MDESTIHLQAELAAAVAGAPPEPTIEPAGDGGESGRPVPGPSDDEILAGYTLVCGEVVDLGANALVPAWRVTPAESGKMAGALARAFVLWFPDLIVPPKYLALLAVAGVAFEIAQARKDPATGRYIPAQLPVEKPAGNNSSTAPAH